MLKFIEKVKMINKIKQILDEYFSRNENEKILKLQTEITALKYNQGIMKDIIKGEEADLIECRNTNSVLNSNILVLRSQLNEAADKITLLSNTDIELEKYCLAHYKVIKMLAYKQKREIKGKYYSIALNELITPNSYEVIQFFKNVKLTDNIYQNAKLLGTITAKAITWTDDKNLDSSGDYYLYPNEIIALKKGDCEDHVFLNCSCNPEIGGAWGFYGEAGHAFNCFVFQDKLFILDTTGNIPEIKEYHNQTKYIIHYIITKNYTFELKSDVRFGEIAGW